MGMVVRTNTMAINAQRQLNMNNNRVAKSLEKLSSGYRINRAGDDAAGLAISEKMKAQIKGLETASLNAQDGISLVQTAEGNLVEVHNMLNRMVELATRAANGTFSDENRKTLQDEVNQLNEEIDRISESANFNGMKLLDGSMGGGASSGSTGGITTDLTTTAVDATAGKYVSAATGLTPPTANKDKVSFTVSLDNGNSYTYEFTVKDAANKVVVGPDGKEVTLSGLTEADFAAEVQKALTEDLKGQFKVTQASGGFTFDAVEPGTAAPAVTGISSTVTVAATGAQTTKAGALAVTAAKDDSTEIASSAITAYDGTNFDDAVFEINGKKFVVAADSVDVSSLDKDINVLTGAAVDAKVAQQLSQVLGTEVKFDTNKLVFAGAPGAAGGSTGGLVLQIGDTDEDYQQLNVSIDSMSATSLGVASVDISSLKGAQGAINTIRSAIDKVSAQRASLGAIQNRLDYTINNLDTTVENLNASNSRIRDTDMAKEMMEYTKMNVLVQSAQAMLAQANQQPQSVLQLLQ